jgi:hypothetical protein
MEISRDPKFPNETDEDSRLSRVRKVLPRSEDSAEFRCQAVVSKALSRPRTGPAQRNTQEGIDGEVRTIQCLPAQL